MTDRLNPICTDALYAKDGELDALFQSKDIEGNENVYLTSAEVSQYLAKDEKNVGQLLKFVSEFEHRCSVLTGQEKVKLMSQKAYESLLKTHAEKYAWPAIENQGLGGSDPKSRPQISLKGNNILVTDPSGKYTETIAIPETMGAIVVPDKGIIFYDKGEHSLNHFQNTGDTSSGIIEAQSKLDSRNKVAPRDFGAHYIIASFHHSSVGENKDSSDFYGYLYSQFKQDQTTLGESTTAKDLSLTLEHAQDNRLQSEAVYQSHLSKKQFLNIHGKSVLAYGPNSQGEYFLASSSGKSALFYNPKTDTFRAGKGWKNSTQEYFQVKSAKDGVITLEATVKVPTSPHLGKGEIKTVIYRYICTLVESPNSSYDAPAGTKIPVD